ncbi:FAD-dependent oxidoreductase [Campylobacter sp.]|uniref:FAD-dependent oxidoreductase n=1 Tax=Campylobacter sp. TaxID=205 RepID=UPI003F9FAB08
MSKIAIIGDSFSALFTALELAKKSEEILVINSQKDDFASGILTPFNTSPIVKDGAISSSFMGLVSKKSELDINLCLNENFRAWMANFTLKSTKAHDKKMRVLFSKFGQKSFEILKNLNEKYPQINFTDNGVYLIFSQDESFKKRLDETKIADSEQEILNIDSELANFGLINKNIKGAINLAKNASIDAGELRKALINELNSLGVKFINDDIYELKTQGQSVQKAVGTSGEYEADSFVIATKSLDLSSKLGTNLNAILAKFYTIDLALNEGQIPKKPIILNDMFAKIYPNKNGVTIITNLQVGAIDTLVKTEKINAFLNELKTHLGISELKEPSFRANYVLLSSNDKPALGRDETYKNLLYNQAYGLNELSFAPYFASVLADLIKEGKENEQSDEILLFSSFYEG